MSPGRNAVLVLGVMWIVVTIGYGLGGLVGAGVGALASLGVMTAATVAEAFL